MVAGNTGLPDPDNPNDDLKDVSNGVILATDDDEDSDDQETVILDQYQPLPMEESADSNQGSSEDEAYGNTVPVNAAGANASLPPITPIENTLVKEVWSTTTPTAVDIQMDNQKVDEVKKAMLSVTLPPSSIPEWAANVPEDEWKNQLMERLQNMSKEKK